MNTKAFFEVLILILVVGGAIGQFVIQKLDKKQYTKEQNKLNNEINSLNSNIDTLNIQLDQKNNEISDLKNRMNIINSLVVYFQIDYKTDQNEITEKQTSAGIQNVIGFFTNDKTRYRFVTDFQFSSEQIDTNIRRVYFKYTPEEPTQVLGKKIEFLEGFDKMGVNLTGFIKPLNLNATDFTYSLNLTILLNGIEVINEKRFMITQEQLNSGTMTFDVDFLFKDIKNVYSKKIENVT